MAYSSAFLMHSACNSRILSPLKLSTCSSCTPWLRLWLVTKINWLEFDVKSSTVKVTTRPNMVTNQSVNTNRLWEINHIYKFDADGNKYELIKFWGQKSKRKVTETTMAKYLSCILKITCHFLIWLVTFQYNTDHKCYLAGVFPWQLYSSYFCPASRPTFYPTHRPTGHCPNARTASPPLSVVPEKWQHYQWLFSDK